MKEPKDQPRLSTQIEELVLRCLVCTKEQSNPAEPLMPTEVPDVVSVWESQKASKVKMKKDYDRRHAARDLPELQPGDAVWIPEFKETGRVLDGVQPRSYVVQTPTIVIQRNRRQMNLTERTPIPSEPPEPKGKDTTEVYPTQEEYTPETPPEVKKPLQTLASRRQQTLCFVLAYSVVLPNVLVLRGDVVSSVIVGTLALTCTGR